MSKSECQNADWRIIGYEDGANGSLAAQIGERRKACAKYDVTPDKVAYDAGYREGIVAFCSYQRGQQQGMTGEVFSPVCSQESDYRTGYDDGVLRYCTYDIGYTEGLAGREYRRVCPGDVEGDFLAGYEPGKHINFLRGRLNNFLSTLNNIDDEQLKLEKQIDALKGRIAYDKDLSSKQRADLLSELDRLKDRSHGLDNEQTEVEGQIDELRHELGRLGAD